MPSSRRVEPEVYKIVYFGPAGSGKRTNLAQLAQGIDGAETFAAAEGSPICALKIPTPVYRKATVIETLSDAAPEGVWQKVLKGVHGIVFVADSDPARYEANIQAMSDVIGKMASLRFKLETFPFVLQYNKRDQDAMVSILKFEDELNPLGLPAFYCTASQGKGVRECLDAIFFLVDKHWRAAVKA